MRGRFGGRRRRRGSDDRKPAIDAGHWLEKIRADEELGIASLDAHEVPGVPGSFALTARGTRSAGEPLLLGFSPTSGGDALLGALAAVAAEPDFSGKVLALAPRWSPRCRQRLSLVAPGGLDLEARHLAGDGVMVHPEAPEPAVWVATERVGAGLESQASRQLFARALSALEGLASKHGGAVTGFGSQASLILMARRVASLRVEGDDVILEALLPKRSGGRLSADRFAGVLDELEGNLRKHLNDRKVRDGEDGMRARLLGLLSDAAAVRDVVPWPLGDLERCVIDLVGVEAGGRPVIGAARANLDVPELAAFLDAALAMRGALATILGGSEGRVLDEAPRLVLAAQSVSPGLQSVLARLIFPHEVYEIRSRRGRGYELSKLVEAEAPAIAVSEISEVTPSAAPEPESSESARPRRRRRGGRGRRGGSGAERRDEAGEPVEETSAEVAEDRDSEAKDSGPVPFEEVSLFDLDEDSRERAPGERRRGGRSRRRGRRAPEGGSPSGEDEERTPAVEPSRGRGESGRGSRHTAGPEPDSETAATDSVSLEEDDEMEELLAPLPDGLSETESEPTYDDDEDGPGAGEAEKEEPTAAMAESAPADERRPRRRVAILAHADRDSLLAAILLARDVRLVEGVWVYPQAELMTFFRSVVTDLKEETPIFVIGFTPSPAREVLQAVSLCSDRLTWLDHHEWPPEDLEAMKRALGEDNVHLNPGAGSSLPGVLAGATRRSRFSDKLVDLATGRFTPHDYQRWGRLWWSRLGDLEGKVGERRADIDPLLVGRPSDLAREAERVSVPEAPQEIAAVANCDFRLVHFAGYTLVVVEVEDGQDPHLTARIARERYVAALSLTRQPGTEVFVLAADEAPGRRSLDVGSGVAHLAAKVAWVEPLPDNDHVARFRIRDLEKHPDRLEEVIGMIAMARSELER